VIWDTPPGEGWILWVAHPPAYKRTRVLELWRQGWEDTRIVRLGDLTLALNTAGLWWREA